MPERAITKRGPGHVQHAIVGARQERGLRLTVSIATWSVIALGLTMMAAWLLRPTWVEATIPSVFAMKFNTALMFVASGAALLAASRDSRRLAISAGGLVLVFCGMTLVEYLTGFSFGIDNSLVPDFIDPKNAYPGRMAPNTSVAFALFALFIQCITNRSQWLRPWRIGATELAALMVFSLGTEGMIGHLHGIALAYTWGSYTRMAVLTAAGFMTLGAGMMTLAWHRFDTRVARIPLWVPGLLCYAVLMADLATPRGVAMGIAYVPLIFCSLWFTRPNTAFVFAALATLLTIIAYFAKEPGNVAVWMVVANRVLTIGVVWFTATLAYMRRQTEMTLRRAESNAARLANIVETSDDAIVSNTLEGNIVSWNAGAERLFGYAAAEIIGQPLSLLFPEALLNEEQYIIDQLRRGKTVDHYDTVRLHKDGRSIEVSLTVSPIRDRTGKIVGASKIARDVSDRRRMERELREFNRTLEEKVAERTAQLSAVNKELEEFAYVASHDLKAPLRVIDNASKWLEEDLREHLTDETRENMALLRGRVGRMEKLLDDLLEYSRIGRSTDYQNTETIAGDALMANILALLSPPACFTVKVDPRFADIQVRRMPLQQILMNLISNAIKHHDKGHGCIDVSVEDGERFRTFTVSDDGPGISAQFHDQIFKMFQTLKPRDQVEGSGMGLAMVRKNVELYGGVLDVKSSEGKGSSFSFTWPKEWQDRREAA